jgi:hypothetical protein
MTVRVERYVDGQGLVEVTSRQETPEELRAAAIKTKLAALKNGGDLSPAQIKDLFKVLCECAGLLADDT